MHDSKISTDLLHDGYVPFVQFRIITAEVMEMLHEYLLFASWEEYFHLCSLVQMEKSYPRVKVMLRANRGKYGGVYDRSSMPLSVQLYNYSTIRLSSRQSERMKLYIYTAIPVADSGTQGARAPPPPLPPVEKRGEGKEKGRRGETGGERKRRMEKIKGKRERRRKKEKRKGKRKKGGGKEERGRERGEKRRKRKKGERRRREKGKINSPSEQNLYQINELSVHK